MQNTCRKTKSRDLLLNPSRRRPLLNFSIFIVDIIYSTNEYKLSCLKNTTLHYGAMGHDRIIGRGDLRGRTEETCLLLGGFF